MNFNRTLTIEEATKMYQSTNGMNFVDTPHNRMIVKQVVDSHLMSLRNAQ